MQESIGEEAFNPTIEPNSSRGIATEAFNRFYFQLGLIAINKILPPKGTLIKWYSDDFAIISAGIRAVLGKDVNPAQAIPKDYQGDGVYEVSFQAESGEIITQREGIQMRGLNMFKDKSFWNVLKDHSQPFNELYPSFYKDRVSLEAFYKYTQQVQSGLRSLRDPRVNFRWAEYDLRNTRVLLLPPP
jgi:hypothetical protein